MNATLVVEDWRPGQLREFVDLPRRLYRNVPNYVPQLTLERLHSLKPGGTPYLRRAQTAYWLACRQDRLVGRISAQLDPLALAQDPDVGHFGLIAADDDPAVVAGLLHQAAEWLRNRGARVMRGPLNLSVNEEVGVLVKGFDTPPMILMPHDPDYLGRHIEAAGFGKARDALAYKLDCTQSMSPAAQSLLDMAPPEGISIRHLDWKDYDGELRRLVTIFNEAWFGNWGFVPFTAEEFDDFGKTLRLLVDERLVWFAEMKGESVGFIVCLPNLNEAIADLDGRLFPSGWLKLLWRLKWRGVRSARVPLMGVKRHVSHTLGGSMIPFLLVGALKRELTGRSIQQVEMSWVLEDNLAMRRVAEALCGEPYKVYRIYERAL